MTRHDSRNDPFRFVDEAVKARWPEAFKERPYLAAVEYKVSLLGAALIFLALAAFVFGLTVGGPWRGLAFSLLVVVAFRAAKPLIRARLYDMEEAKRAASKPAPERQDASRDEVGTGPSAGNPL